MCFRERRDALAALAVRIVGEAHSLDAAQQDFRQPPYVVVLRQGQVLNATAAAGRSKTLGE